MKIRVAYDISVLASHFNRFDSKLGVTRVIEELLWELSKREELEMTAVGLCGEDPLFDSLRSGLYVNSLAGRVRCDFRPSFKSRLGLDGLYSRFFGPYLAGAGAEGGLRSFFERGVRGALYRLSYTYGVDRFERVFDPAEYDVFHSTFPRLPPEELTAGVPRVLTIYDLIPVLAPQFVVPRITSDFERLLASINTRRDWIACISEHAKREFCDYTGMDSARVFVTPLAAAAHFRPVEDDERAASARRRYGLEGRRYFLSLAVPQPRKNLAHLIRCFYRLLDEHPAASDTYLVLAGSKDQGWMYEEVFAALEESPRHRARVLFPGYVPDEDLGAVYGGALAFVYPSLHEGFGLPALEALACGAAVIASDTTSLPEVVGDAGLLVDPTDADALCAAMLKMIEDAGLREELGRRGLERAAGFSWERCAAQTAEVYRVAAGERAGGS